MFVKVFSQTCHIKIGTLGGDRTHASGVLEAPAFPLGYQRIKVFSTPIMIPTAGINSRLRLNTINSVKNKPTIFSIITC